MRPQLLDEAHEGVGPDGLAVHAHALAVRLEVRLRVHAGADAGGVQDAREERDGRPLPLRPRDEHAAHAAVRRAEEVEQRARAADAPAFVRPAPSEASLEIGQGVQPRERLALACYTGRDAAILG